ncbi:Aste57867_18319 [Aphanomyces stellatus]|uniref:Aste57867_18319 protein n=1 Tax=Aphanomyces stellatus TaxID=120398 RepID=A0A485KGL7_9STRA|nr:hypothetical protein As57867_018257 [Aphanomyces stellatus]KAF0711089.1 hypothetical protein As57867_005375 [Aphanomyces stellatus]VFT82446.1 Aste57867_5388 [Aphanomyces stellatus]VFT95055.1 Aste57867_18319 [Aphanomyces stellatus]
MHAPDEDLELLHSIASITRCRFHVSRHLETSRQRTMRVHPVVPESPRRPTTVHANKWWVLLGSMYLVLSMTCSLWYVLLLQPAFANDVWWADYLPNAHQALLVDLFNGVLTTQTNGSVDILAPQAVVDKNYIASVATTNVYPTHVRRLILNELVSVEYAVVNLRLLSAGWSMWMYTPYCWVDLNRAFEVAHTAARQQRCADRYSTNGAVYMETVLRNQDWDTFLQMYGGDGGMFTVSVQEWLVQVPAGQAWISTTSTALVTHSLAQEVTHWKAKNISHFRLQWLNYWQSGITETMVLENALGMQQTITLKNVPRTDESWTTENLYWMPINDLSFTQSMNLSLIRSATNSFVQSPSFDFEMLLGLTDPSGNYDNQTQLFRATVGTFGSVDAYYVAVPPALLALYAAFRQGLYKSPNCIAGVQDRFDTISDVTLYPSPLPWTTQTFQFYGGNPMCLNGGSRSFVQETFGFYDNCDRQSPLSATLTKQSGEFAIFAMADRFNLSGVCALSSTPNSFCQDHLKILEQMSRPCSLVSQDMAPVVQPATNAIKNLSVCVMQYASDREDSTWIALQQPLLDSTDWDFYGWVFLNDWVEGKREVVSFEGDIADMVLISTADTPQPVTSSTTSLPNATKLIFWLAVYVSIVLCCIALVCLLLVVQLRLNIHGPNLMWFNPIVGSIWIGRPLLFLRSCTAIILLGTTQLELVQLNQPPRARFEFAPRPLLHTLIICGEATWFINVASDFLAAAMTTLTPVYSNIGCVFAWIALVFMETSIPVKPVAILNRVCSSHNMDQAISCQLGTLWVGNINRCFTVAGTQVISLLFGLTISEILRRRKVSTKRAMSRHWLGIADNFFPLPDKSRWNLDDVALVMAGIVPVHWGVFEHVFDLKLWISRKDPRILKSSTFHIVNINANASEKSTLNEIRRLQSALKVLCAGLGILYAICAIVGSVSYLQLSKISFSNDMFWANFNMTGAHVFIANWLNSQLILGVTNLTTSLNIDFINQVGSFDRPSGAVQSAANFGALMQYTQLNTIEAAIIGLRSTDGATFPWIFTQYCFLDFGQRWELANSEPRQKRCKLNMTTNGAVFMEPILRNINFNDFYAAVGSSFDVAIANELKRSNTGFDWLRKVSNPIKLAIADEIVMWTNYSITSFETQWQNYKLIGLTNVYSVTNMYGVAYPLTLQYREPFFRLSKQTTFKMYWGLANDLTALMLNNTDVSGCSLIRSSSVYAFANTTLENVMIQNGTLAKPFANSLQLTRNEVGPFGSVDLKFIAIPLVAKVAVHNVFSSIRKSRYRSLVAQAAFSQISDVSNSMLPVPKAWTDINFLSLGGNPLCQEIPFAVGLSVGAGLIALLSWDQQCTRNDIWINMLPDRESVIAALVLANTSMDIIDAMCVQNPHYEPQCLLALNQSIDFVTTYMGADLIQLNQLALEANDAIYALNVQLLQYGQQDSTSPLTLYQINILDPTQLEFKFYAWLFLVDWALGYREVIAFHGDHGSMSLITEYLFPLIQRVNTAENPVNFAIYLRTILWYVTSALIAVAGLMLTYVFLSRGLIEIWNVFELQRVGAIVWVGRPLLVVRSFTAIGLLSTCSLQLYYTGYISFFAVVPSTWFETILAANEVTWLVAIVNDLAMAWTQEYTKYYCYVNSTIVWLITACLSLSMPVAHNMSISKQCHVAQIDLHVVCTSANITIGDFSRLVALSAIVVGCNAVCYFVTFLVVRSPRRPQVQSVLLYSGAKYLFETSAWIQKDTYYMDRMSAVVNGILTLQWGNHFYGLDIKLWCTFQIPVADLTDEGDVVNAELITRAKFALPLSVYEVEW